MLSEKHGKGERNLPSGMFSVRMQILNEIRIGNERTEAGKTVSTSEKVDGKGHHGL